MNSVTTTPSKEGLLERLGRTSGKELESKLLPAVARVVELWGLPLLLVYALGRSLTLASRAPLWFDELLVREISRQGSLSAIWKVLKTGFDGQPPPVLTDRASRGIARPERADWIPPAIDSGTAVCFVGPFTGDLLLATTNLHSLFLHTQN